MQKYKKHLEKLILTIITLALIFTGFKLFAKTQSNITTETFSQNPLLTVIYPFEITEFQPQTLDSNQRQILSNIYQSLLTTDENFNHKPQIAISWGQISPTIWEFHLRENIKLHDNTALTSKEVVNSLELSLQSPDLESLTKNIQKIEQLSAQTLRIHLKNPDNLFLNKISKIYIQKDNLGTGPYIPESTTELQQNPYYWGEKPKHQEIEAIYEPNKQNRIDLILQSQGDLLLYPPFDTWELLKEKNVNIAKTPSLEVQFLIFNTNSKIFTDITNRQLIKQIIKSQDFTTQVPQAIPANQFVSSGIFGYHSQLKQLQQELDPSSLQGQTIQIHLPQNLDTLGEFLRKTLAAENLQPIISYLPPQEFLESLQSQKADLYFLGFKSELADSQQFFSELVIPDAEFNFLDYNSPQIQQLYTQANQEKNNQQRLSILKNMMETAVNTNPFGIPLFEYQNAYAYQQSIQIKTRLDGLVLFDNITKQ